jgi:hypothetical protein
MRSKTKIMSKTPRRRGARDVGALAAAAWFAASACVAQPSADYHETTPEQWAGLQWSTAKAGQPLDPRFYATAPALNDTFNIPGCPEIGNYSVGRPNPGFTWYTIAGQMGKGVNGVEHIHDRSADDPFDCSAGHLKIKLFYSNIENKWIGGSIASNDWSGDGATFTNGYYEIAAALPPHWSPGLQPWMAVWLNGRTSPRANPTYHEVDILETLTKDNPGTVLVTLHEWPANTPAPGQLAAHRQNGYKVSENLWDGKVHLYGVLRSPDEECTVFDRTIQQCFPVVGDEMRGPLSILVDSDIMFAPTDTSQTSEIDVMRATFYPCPESRPQCAVDDDRRHGHRHRFRF